ESAAGSSACRRQRLSPFLLRQSPYSALGLLAPAFRSEAELDQRFHHLERTLKVSATLEVTRVRERELRAERVVAVEVRALVTGERGVDLAGALEAARESECSGCVVGRAAGP